MPQRRPGGEQYNYPEYRVTIQIVGPFRQYVGPDSIALIKKSFGVAGSHYIEVLPSRMTEAEKQQGQGWDELEARVADPLALDATLARTNELLDQLADPQGQVQQLLANLRTITGQIAQEQGSLTRMVLTETQSQQLDRAIANLESLTAALSGESTDESRAHGLVPRLLHDKAMADNIHESLASINGTLASLNEEARDLTGLVLQTQALLHETTELMEGLQRHWLLRGAFEAQVPVDDSYLSPDEIGVEFPSQ